MTLPLKDLKVSTPLSVSHPSPASIQRPYQEAQLGVLKVQKDGRYGRSMMDGGTRRNESERLVGAMDEESCRPWLRINLNSLNSHSGI